MNLHALIALLAGGLLLSGVGLLVVVRDRFVRWWLWERGRGSDAYYLLCCLLGGVFGVCAGALVEVSVLERVTGDPASEQDSREGADDAEDRPVKSAAHDLSGQAALPLIAGEDGLRAAGELRGLPGSEFLVGQIAQFRHIELAKFAGGRMALEAGEEFLLIAHAGDVAICQQGGQVS